MKLKPNFWTITKAFIGIFILASLIIFAICLNIFLFQEWTFVQPLIIGIFVALSLFFYILSLKAFYYEVSRKAIIVHRGTKVLYYYYSDIAYFDEDKARQKKSIAFLTNKGHVRYLPLDKDFILLDTLIENCNNLVSLEEARRRYPGSRI